MILFEFDKAKLLSKWNAVIALSKAKIAKFKQFLISGEVLLFELR